MKYILKICIVFPLISLFILILSCEVNNATDSSNLAPKGALAPPTWILGEWNGTQGTNIAVEYKFTKNSVEVTFTATNRKQKLNAFSDVQESVKNDQAYSFFIPSNNNSLFYFERDTIDNKKLIGKIGKIGKVDKNDGSITSIDITNITLTKKHNIN